MAPAKASWFNHRRPHAPIRNIPPNEAEENCFAQRDVLVMFAESEVAGLWQKRRASSGQMHFSQRRLASNRLVTDGCTEPAM